MREFLAQGDAAAPVAFAALRHRLEVAVVLRRERVALVAREGGPPRRRVVGPRLRRAREARELGVEVPRDLPPEPGSG